MLSLAKNNKLAIGSDCPFKLTFTRATGDTISLVNCLITINFASDGVLLPSWELSTAAGLTRTTNTATEQVIEGNISRVLTGARSHQDKIDYFAAITAGGLTKISPDYTGYFHLFDPKR